MKFPGNHVMTKDKEVNIGDKVCYYESMPTTICDCEVLEVYSDDKEYGFKLKIVKNILNGGDVGEEFSISALQGNHAYGGMWRLYPEGEYR